jgi:hypothetical protein
MSHDANDPLALREGSGAESVIDILLLMHRQFSRVPMYIGEPHVLSMNGFILGYELCLSMRGIVDQRYTRFREWLRDIENGLPPDAWYMRNLQDSGGDHLQAIRKLLDRVAGFHSLGEPDAKTRGHVSQHPSAGQQVPEVESVIDMLLRIRRESGRLLMYIGEPNVLSLNGFILGFRICLSMKGNTDDRYYRFREWLRSVRQEFPSEGWCARYLRDCDGDHLRAIHKFLDRVAEHHVQEEHGSP